MSGLGTSGMIAREHRGEPSAPLLFLFHGTGGDENQLFGLGRELLPEAGLVSPRGQVSEGGMARFFRRTGEGVYDMDDLARRTEAMAAFVAERAAEHRADQVLGLGYSNGANILASVMLAQPKLFAGAVLMHPLIPFEAKATAPFPGTRVLVTAGRRDPICPPALTQRLTDALNGQGAAAEVLWHDGGHELRPVEVEEARRFLAGMTAHKETAV